jgi:hypothetical protein
MVDYGEVWKESDILKGPASPKSVISPGKTTEIDGPFPIFKDNTSGVGFYESCDTVKNRGLSCSIGSDQSSDFARVKIDVQA